MNTIRNILVTTDFSEHSASALEYAQTLSVATKAVIHLLHVLPELHLGGKKETRVPGEETPAGGISKREEGAKDEMTKFIAEHVDEYTFVRSAIVLGHPAKEILRYAQEQEIDLIIMATHGRTGLAHILMGSVAETIVRHSTVPVLTVKPSEMIDPIITKDDVEQALHLTGGESGAKHRK